MVFVHKSIKFVLSDQTDWFVWPCKIKFMRFLSNRFYFFSYYFYGSPQRD